VALASQSTPLEDEFAMNAEVNQLTEAAMKAKDLMTPSPACVTSEDSAQRAAQLMADNDCGCLPVVAARDDGKVIGVVTDRDLALRGVARGRGPDTPVRELMTSNPCCCAPEADIHDLEQMMADRKLRRIVIADADGRCLGMVSQADLARAAERGRGVSEPDVARVIERISEPSGASPRTVDRAGSRELQF
jgi:CBS domain-containing protein